MKLFDIHELYINTNWSTNSWKKLPTIEIWFVLILKPKIEIKISKAREKKTVWTKLMQNFNLRTMHHMHTCVVNSDLVLMKNFPKKKR